ncbi:MAG TPA: response regulator transcription factor [Abditibacteriaceae bacterium]|nr:response regulator transcription factor [Abditibacteriaceae bacterium]
MNVLVIDDEPQIRRALRIGLERNGYAVTLARAGEEGLDLAAAQPPDIVILDLAMPGIEGLEVCRQLRAWSKTPVIVLSVREHETDKVAALDAGADDYLTKPFSLEELLARMRAVLRRAPQDAEPQSSLFSMGDLTIDFARRRVTLANRDIHLTPTEYELLKFMAQHPDRVLTHRHLLSKIWGNEYADDVHTLRVHIANLRDKIEPDPARPRFLHTEPRIGYRFRVE